MSDKTTVFKCEICKDALVEPVTIRNGVFAICEECLDISKGLMRKALKKHAEVKAKAYTKEPNMIAEPEWPRG